MAGMIGRGRGLTVDTLEDNPVPGIAPMQPEPLRAASPILDNSNQTTSLTPSETPATPETAVSQPSMPPQSPGQFEEASPQPASVIPTQHQTQDAPVSPSFPVAVPQPVSPPAPSTAEQPVADSIQQQPAVQGNIVPPSAEVSHVPEDTLPSLPKPNDGPPMEETAQPVQHAHQKKPLSPGLLPYQLLAGQSPNEQQDDMQTYGSQTNKHEKEHYGNGENYGKGDSNQTNQHQSGHYNNPKHRQSPNENQSMPHGPTPSQSSKKSYVPPQFQQNQQQSEMQQLYMKEQQLKEQKLQLQRMQQVQQEGLASMSPQQQEELFKRQAQLEKLQDNQIRLVQVQQKQLQIEHLQPQSEQQYVQKQQKLMHLQEEQMRLQQVQMDFMEHREQQQMMEKQQRLAKEQVSEFFQSQSMSPEQILQQFGSQGVIGGRGKRLEELTKHVQARQPGPNSPRQYGKQMPQPGYMMKEEMGRNRLGSQEEHRQSPYESTDVMPHGSPNTNQYHQGSSGKHPRSTPPPPSSSPRRPVSSRPPPDGNPPIPAGSSMGLDDISLPPGVPTHLPPPPLAVGLLDQMSLGGGYGQPDMGAFTGSGAPSQYNYPPFPQVKGEGQGMYYNKKGPIKSVHQVGQNQHQKQHKGQQVQKGQAVQAGGYKKKEKQQQQQVTPATTQKQQKQQQATPSTPPKGPLSNEEQKNEYEWQKFKIVRKVKKALDGMKEDEEEETANEIIKVLKEESQRLANFPWPKEQYVALGEIFVKAVDSCKDETHKQMIKLLLILHKLHPENLCTDLKKVIIDKHQLYVKVSPATNAKTLYDSCVSFLLELHSAAGKAEEQTEFKETMSKFVLTLITKWTAYDAEDKEQAEVYTFCLMAFFRQFAPLMDEEVDKKFYAIIRENQLKGKNRAMREGLLDLLLFQNTGWKTEPTRPEKPAEVDTEKAPEEEKSVTDEADKTPEESNQESADCVDKQEQKDSNEEKSAQTNPDQDTKSEFDVIEQRAKELQAQGNVNNNQSVNVIKPTQTTVGAGGVENQALNRPGHSPMSNVEIPMNQPNGSPGMGYQPMPTQNAPFDNVNMPPQMHGSVHSKGMEGYQGQPNVHGLMNVPPPQSVLQQVGQDPSTFVHMDSFLQGQNRRNVVSPPNQHFTKPMNPQTSVRLPEPGFQQQQAQNDLMSPAAFTSRADVSQMQKQNDRNYMNSPPQQTSTDYYANPRDMRGVRYSSQEELVKPSAYGSMGALSQMQGRKQSPTPQTQQAMYEQFALQGMSETFGQVSQAQIEHLLALQAHSGMAGSPPLHPGFPSSMPNVRPSLSNTSMQEIQPNSFPSRVQSPPNQFQSSNMAATFHQGMVMQQPRMPYVGNAQFAMSQSPELSSSPPLSQTPPMHAHAQSPDMMVYANQSLGMPPSSQSQPVGLPSEFTRQYQASPTLTQSAPSLSHSQQTMGHVQQHMAPSSQANIQQHMHAPTNQAHVQQHTAPPNQVHVQQHTAPPNQGQVQQHTAPPNQVHAQQHTAPPNQARIPHHMAPPNQAHIQQHTIPTNQAHVQQHAIPPNHAQQHTPPPNQPILSNIPPPSLLPNQQGLPTSQVPTMTQWSTGDAQVHQSPHIPDQLPSVLQDHHNLQYKMNPNASAFQPQIYVSPTTYANPPTDQSLPQPQASPLTSVAIDKRQSIDSVHSSGGSSDTVSPIKQGQVNQITDLCQPGSIFGSGTTSGVTSSRFPRVNSADVSLDEGNIIPSSPAASKTDEEMPELEEHLSVSSSDHGTSIQDRNSRPCTPQDTVSALNIDVNSDERNALGDESEGSLSPNKERELEIKALIEMGLSNDEPQQSSWSSKYDSATSASSVNNNFSSNQQPNQEEYPALQSPQDTLMAPQQFSGRGRISRAKGAIKSPHRAPQNSNNNGFTETNQDLITPQQFQKPIGNSTSHTRQPKSQSMASMFTQNQGADDVEDWD